MTDYDAMPVSDDLVIDFTDVQAKTFEPVPAGWYLVEITSYEQRATKNQGKTMPAGTPGINIELSIIDPEQFVGRKVWTNFWFYPTQLGFLKTFLQNTNAFSNDQLNAPLTWGMFEVIVGVRLYAKVRVKPAQGQYQESNEVQTTKSETEQIAVGVTGGATDSMLP